MRVHTGLLPGALASILAATPALADVYCGSEVTKPVRIMERASKFHSNDRKSKIALGSLIAECEEGGKRLIVSSPDGKADHRIVEVFVYPLKGQ